MKAPITADEREEIGAQTKDPRDDRIQRFVYGAIGEAVRDS